MEQSIAIDSTTDLHSAAVVMDSVADAVGRAVRVLADTLTLLGDPITVQHNGSTAESAVAAGSSANPPWGTDSYGKSFADGNTGYVNLSTDLLQGGFDLAHTLSQFAHGMSRAAGDLDSTEENATAAFS
ncbi:hypothetical protein [Nocardia sp. XZ_19_369]|uniref:hypothetical protein n=1 Tax=Nocardia sp. XZ_19_369 TaxID=2769487 RepID=UPI00188FF05A|nr:hypothetical protein [Nocardia sp. XZ_19_369]